MSSNMKIVIYGNGELPDRATINESEVCRAQLIRFLLKEHSTFFENRLILQLPKS